MFSTSMYQNTSPTYMCSDPSGNGKTKKEAKHRAYLSQNCSGGLHSFAVKAYPKISDESNGRIKFWLYCWVNNVSFVLVDDYSCSHEYLCQKIISNSVSFSPMSFVDSDLRNTMKPYCANLIDPNASCTTSWLNDATGVKGNV